MGLIRSWADKTEDILRNSSELASLLRQRNLIGDSRERFLLDSLQRFLPTTLLLGRGEVLDSYENRSRQIDIVIARGDAIRLPLSEGDYAFPLESVVGVVEVKTQASPSTTVEAFRVFRSVLHLGFVVTVYNADPRDEARQEAGDHLTEEEVKAMFPWEHLRPATYLYAFQASVPQDPKDFGALILACADQADLSFDALPSIISVPGWVAIKNDGSLIPDDVYPDKGWLMAYRREDYPLYWILAHLLHRTTFVLGAGKFDMPPARYHMETHLDPLPLKDWNLLLDPRSPTASGRPRRRGGSSRASRGHQNHS